jgi:hypothetical protein
MSDKTIGKIGVGSWTFPWATGTVLNCRPEPVLGPVDLVQRASDLGVHVVHFLDNLPLDECDDRSIDRASKLATQEGIEVEIGTRSTDPEHLLNYLKIAQRMNARLIRTMGGSRRASAAAAHRDQPAEGLVSLRRCWGKDRARKLRSLPHFRYKCFSRPDQPFLLRDLS